MAAGERIAGGCLCGAARFGAELSEGVMSVCHCGMCRRWTSSVFMSFAVRPASLAFEDEGAVGLFASSAEAERGFCRICGSPLFWRMKDGSSADVSAQAVEGAGRFRFATEIFIDEKPAHYDFANPTRKLTGAEWLVEKGDGNG